MTRSTPEALWSSPAVRVLRPAAVACRGVDRPPHLRRFGLSVPVGARLLVVSRPEASASLLLRVLARLSPSGGGRIELSGVADPYATGWARRVAYVGPGPALYPWMTPREALELTARLQALPPDEARRRIAWAVEHHRLGEQLDEPIGRAGDALGQRLALAAAMLADPEVLLLDEPLRAVDPDERTRLLRIPGRRRTVLLASRYPASEAGLCTQVAFIREGRLAVVARISQLEEHGLPLSLRGIEALAADGGIAAAPARVGVS